MSGRRWMWPAVGGAVLGAGLLLWGISRKRNLNIVRRAVIDMGSGTTKLLVAEVDQTRRLLRKSLYDEEREVFLAHDMSKQREKLKVGPSGAVPLSEEIQKDAIATVTSYVEIAKKFGVKREDITGFATAVFREATNAAEVLERIKKETGVCISIISQEREGEVGFSTAKAMLPLVHPELSSMDEKHLCVWDSGGASFQLTMRRRQSAAAGESKCSENTTSVQVYQGPLGSAKMHAALVQLVQKKPNVNVTPNPVTPEEARKLSEFVSQTLPPSPEWLRSALEDSDGKTRVVCIGGRTSAFAIAQLATGRASWTQDQLWKAILECCNKTDEDFSKLGFPQEVLVRKVLPKLVLVWRVMVDLKISVCEYIFTQGGCAGVMIE